MFDLSAAMIRALESTDATDPHDIADVMLAGMDAGEAAEALAEALPVWVRTEMSRTRMLTPTVLHESDSTNHAGSVSVARVRSDWQTRLRTPLRVGGAYKRLGDCDAVDLRTVAEQLRRNARRTQSKAQWYEDLADAVASLGLGATAADLPVEPGRAAA